MVSLSYSIEDFNEQPLYKDRKEWQDIVPISQATKDLNIITIQYSSKFEDAYDHFRAILLKGEISDRALHLTRDCVILNPANYTVWHYRRVLLEKLNKNLEEELEFVTHLLENNSKNYQLWHHRGIIVEKLNDPSNELSFTDDIFHEDAKNYHAWQHRQWVLKKFNLWEGELNYTTRMIKDDVRNNSAWNHRYFVIKNTTRFTTETLVKEIDFTKGMISNVVNNESSWNYLRGLHIDKNLYADIPEIIEFCIELRARSSSSHLLSFMVNYYKDQLRHLEQSTSADGNGFHNKSLKDFALGEALKICYSLADEHDIIRKNYWHYIAQGLKDQYIPKMSTC